MKEVKNGSQAVVGRRKTLVASITGALMLLGCGGGNDVRTVGGSSAGTATLLAETAITSTSATSTHPVRSCSSLMLVLFPDGSKVTSAVEVPESNGTPKHCEVTLLVPDRINILVSLPIDNWNGRYQAVGNMGYAGAILPDKAGLTHGYALSQTDTGHQGAILNGEWAWSPTGMNSAQIQDFAYRANHEMAVKSKALIGEFYGTAPTYSYWNGCSTGGREGITAAMRYPADFDGIYAGAPAINWTKFTPSGMWPQLVMKESANYLASCKADGITALVTEACDMTDGVKDGLFDSRTCNFDPKTLLGKQTSCGSVTDLDVAVIEKIWQGARRRNGEFMWYGLEPGSSLGPALLALGNTVSAPDGTAVDGVPFAITNDWFKWWLHKDPLWDWHSLTYDQFERDFDQSVSEWASVLATNNADLSAFRNRGGKLLVWHGLADPVIPPRGSIDYFERMNQQMGQGRVRDFSRLFLAPNVGHCSGGTGPNPVDPFGVMVKWREQGQAPQTLAASSNGVTRQLCAYPQVSVYKGAGDPNDPANFRCEQSKK